MSLPPDPHRVKKELERVPGTASRPNSPRPLSVEAYFARNPKVLGIVSVALYGGVLFWIRHSLGSLLILAPLFGWAILFPTSIVLAPYFFSRTPTTGFVPLLVLVIVGQFMLVFCGGYYKAVSLRRGDVDDSKIVPWRVIGLGGLVSVCVTLALLVAVRW